MESAWANFSRYLPPFTRISLSDADEIAFIVAIGIVSFRAQEKSTIKKDLALIKFLVKR